MFREILPKFLNILKIFKKNFGRFRGIDICSKILRKFKGTVRKLLKQAIWRTFFLYFGNIFRNNCAKFQVNVRKLTIVGNSQFERENFGRNFPQFLE